MKKVFRVVIVLLVIAVGGWLKWFFTAPPKPRAKPYNILYLSSDSFNRRHLSIYGYKRRTTPFLEELAERGVVFEQMINPSGWTNENLVSIFSGLYSPVHGVNTRMKNIDPQWVTPIEMLKEQGYAVPRLSPWQGDQNHSELGFDEPTPMDPDVWLEKFVKENPGKPFFLFYQFLVTHLPYNCSEDTSFLSWYSDDIFKDEAQLQRVGHKVMWLSVIPYGSVQFQPEDKEIIHRLYDSEVQLVDSYFRRVVDKLDELGLRENTIIIVGTDHGEELLEHGFVGHASTSKHANLHDEIINIPFMISFPKELPSGIRVTSQVRGVDVLPTVLDLLGLPVPDYLQGRSLLPVIRGEEGDRVAFSESSREGYGAKDPKNIQEFIRSVRTPEWKLIQYLYRENMNKFELFNLTDDPFESEDVIAKYPEKTSELKQMLLDWQIRCKQMKPPSDVGEEYLSPYERWNRERARQSRPIDWDNVPSPPDWIDPRPGQVVNFNTFQGKAVFRWTGEDNVPYVVQYEAGKGNFYLDGEIKVKGNKKVFGPFTKHYWNQFLSQYSPVRIRVSVDREPREWSPWIECQLGKVP